MDLKDKVILAGLAATWVGILSKFKVVEMWMEDWFKQWAAKRSARSLVQKLDLEVWTERARTSGRTSLETAALMLKQEYRADRVTVVEYFRAPEGTGMMLTMLVEERTARMPSIILAMQKVPVQEEIWAEVLRIHAQDLHCLFVPIARLVELPAMRDALLGSGVLSAYYQTIPAATGHAGGLLAISWKEEQLLTPERLATLNFSGMSLAGVLQMLWELKPIEKS